MENIKPMLVRIQALKSGSGGALSGTQLMSFFSFRSEFNLCNIMFQSYGHTLAQRILLESPKKT
jgi:hypothetical protein